MWIAQLRVAPAMHYQVRMRPFSTHVARSVVYVLGTRLSCAKMVDPIETSVVESSLPISGGSMRRVMGAIALPPHPKGQKNIFERK